MLKQNVPFKLELPQLVMEQMQMIIVGIMLARKQPAGIIRAIMTVVLEQRTRLEQI